MDGVKDEYLDDCEDRYSKLRESSHSYIINQFGLSVFKQIKGDASANAPVWKGEALSGQWEAATFNFYIFPEPLKDSNQV